MITGDKLQTAKNIGLACNLINADMIPDIPKGSDLFTAANVAAQSRLVEITGVCVCMCVCLSHLSFYLIYI